MTFSRTQRPSFISTLFILFIALQISACSTEDRANAVTDSTEQDKQTIDDTGTNNTITFSGIDSGSVIEDDDPNNNNLLEVGGTLNITDLSNRNANFIAGTITGSYGKLDIDTAGNWLYTANNNQALIQNLSAGETLIDSLTVNGISGASHIIIITIIGVDEIATPMPNQPAIISGVNTGTVIEDIDPDNDNLLEVSAKLNIIDYDAGEAAFIASTINGSYGNLIIHADGNWHYAADNTQTVIQNLSTGEALTETLTVRSIDGTAHTVLITILGADEIATNTPAIISGVNTGSVTEDVDPNNNNLLEVSAKLNITDPDAGEAAFVAKTINGAYGSLTINTAGNWSYAADNTQTVIQNLATGATLTDSLIINSVDGTTHTITITILGIDEISNNTPAIISGANTGSVTEDVDPNNNNLLEVSAKLNITDPDAGEAAFIAKTINGAYGSLTINTAGNWSYAADNTQTVIQNLATGTSLTDSLIVNSIDGTTHTIVITIFGVDENTTTANITLSWVAPVAREDNSPLSLSAIAGYKIYYGTTPGKYPNSASINDGSATGYVFNNLTSATYYFVVTTIDTDGRESQYSTEITISI